MLFTFSWACKNLLSNRKRTLKKLGFMTMAITMVFACLGLLRGSDRQMAHSMRYSYGDLWASARTPSVDLREIAAEVEGRAGESGRVFREFRKEGRLLGPAGYASASLHGVEPDFVPFFEKSVGWNRKPDKDLERGQVFLDARIAHALRVDYGDQVTVRIQSDDGFVNADQFDVAGVFMGNPWLFDNLALLHVDDMRALFLQEGAVNRITVFAAPGEDLRKLKSDMDIKHSRKALFATLEDLGGDIVVMVFGYYRAFLLFVIAAIVVTFSFILYFAMQNVYFMEYRARRKELATMLTFGMRPGSLLAVVGWETAISFVCSIGLSAIVLACVDVALGIARFTRLDQQQIVALLGGNRIVLEYEPLSLAVVGCALAFICLHSATRSAGNYLRLHVREIITSE